MNGSINEPELLSSFLNQYDSDVKGGKAPLANAWYIASRHPEKKKNVPSID
jgi:hypothetical protein